MLSLSGAFDNLGQTSLIKIKDENLPLLNGVLSLNKRRDSYTTSPAYYLMTGRNGLWIYGDNETAMLIARHPNDSKQLLLFPPFGKDPFGLIQKARSDNSLPEGKLRLARVSDEDITWTQKLKATAVGKEVEENLLDWRYPIHILGTKKVSEHKGSDFKDFRKNINRAYARGLKAEIITTHIYLSQALSICERWAQKRFGHNGSMQDLMAPTEKALELFETKNTSMSGIIVYEKDCPVSYIVWEETDPAAGIANSISGMSVCPRGTDEFTTMEMCRILLSRGFMKVCIGGSETEGLDAFKRKMCPIDSIRLSSFSIKPYAPRYKLIKEQNMRQLQALPASQIYA